MAKWCKIFLALLFLPSLLYPQYQNIKFEHISVEQGLSHGNVQCIVQDYQGFMWFSKSRGRSTPFSFATSSTFLARCDTMNTSDCYKTSVDINKYRRNVTNHVSIINEDSTTSNPSIPLVPMRSGKSEFVTLKIYNVLGEEVATLVSERLTAGQYKYDWPARSSGGDTSLLPVESIYTGFRRVIMSTLRK